MNFGIPKKFCYATYEDYDYFVFLLTYVGQNCFIIKADIEAAFRIITVHLSDYHLLDFMFEDLCLQMGCSVSCSVFEQFSCTLQWILQTVYHVAHMSHIHTSRRWICLNGFKSLIRFGFCQTLKVSETGFAPDWPV